LAPTAHPRTVEPVEDLLAMKDTARRADHQRKHRGPVRAGFVMKNEDLDALAFDSAEFDVTKIEEVNE